MGEEAEAAKQPAVAFTATHSRGHGATAAIMSGASPNRPASSVLEIIARAKAKKEGRLEAVTKVRPHPTVVDATG